MSPMRMAMAVVGFVVLLGGLAFLTCTSREKADADAAAKALFAAAGGPAKDWIQALHPDMGKAVDPFQLGRMLVETEAQLGPLQGYDLNGFTAQAKGEGESLLSIYKGTMKAEKGSFPLELVLRGEKLYHLAIPDDELAKVLNQRLATPPKSADPYVGVGRDFWVKALGGAADQAFAMLYPEFATRLGRDAFFAQLASLAANGPIQQVRFQRALRDPQHPGKMHLVYLAAFPKAQATAHVTFQYVGLHAHLVGYQLPSPFAAQASAPATPPATAAAPASP